MAETEKKAPAGKLVEGRVLMTHLDHKADDVIALPTAEAEAAVAAGWLDTNADAVAFAKSLAAPAAPAADA
jgi:hypothetical protein